MGNGEERTILSGIRKWYPDPEQLIGKRVIACINLKPRKMVGIMSEGMLLSAFTPKHTQHDPGQNPRVRPK